MTTAFMGTGVGLTRTIAMGPAFLVNKGQLRISAGYVQRHAIDEEIDRLRNAMTEAGHALRAVRKQIPPGTPPDIAEFIDTHMLMLEDAILADAACELIRTHAFTAEWALQMQRNELVRVFEQMDDPYLRTRKDDIDHVVRQIQHLLQGVESGSDGPLDSDYRGKIILARDLTPADTIVMRHQGIAAFVTEHGSPVSHTAILARSLGIPAVVGVHQITELVQSNELLVVDGEKGVVLADLDNDMVGHYRRRIAKQEARQVELRRFLVQPSQTQDGEPVSLWANIDFPDDIQLAINHNANGIGLFRTEYLFMNRQRPPDEEEHLATYSALVLALNGMPLTIRTFDLGADKVAPPSVLQKNQNVTNPALGLRAIRLCLQLPNLFRPQLRAILRASALGPVRLMVPMLTTLDEVRQVHTIIEEIKAELKAEGLPFDARIPIGGMIEVPSAALTAQAFARELDFLSIGTNDLIQYTLAIDRVDDEVNYLFDPLHPAVLQLIQGTIQAARSQQKTVSICGEMAGEPRFTRLLMGLGLREFSMQPASILEVKEIICSSNLQRVSERTRHFLERQRNHNDTRELLEELNRE